MKLIWTKNKLPVSKLIRSLTGEPVSHFAVVFDDKLVFHSNFLGVHVAWYESFKRSSDVVFAIDLDMGLPDEEAMYQSIITEHDGRKYDFKGAFYLGWRKLLSRLIGADLPKRNAWGRPNRDFCVELFDRLPARIRSLIRSPDCGMITPYHLYLELSWAISQGGLGGTGIKTHGKESVP